MLFDRVLEIVRGQVTAPGPPAVLKKALEAGEEQVGKVVGKLLGSGGLGEGVGTLVSTARQAKETLERGVSQALHAANLPSRDDVAALKRRLEELESMLDGISARLGRGGGRGEGNGR